MPSLIALLRKSCGDPDDFDAHRKVLEELAEELRIIAALRRARMQRDY